MKKIFLFEVSIKPLYKNHEFHKIFIKSILYIFYHFIKISINCIKIKENPF